MTPSATGGVQRAFGAGNRLRLLRAYFQKADPVTAANAWEHVYRLLLWIDPTTGLAHCYESDKSQPGRAWYARSLAFHGWVAQSLGTTPGELSEKIDWLFNAAVEDLVAWVAQGVQARESRTAEQRAPYEGQGFPEPGEDPELAQIITGGLAGYLSAQPPPAVLNDTVRRVRAHVSQENKRRNLVGEGFEDTLAEIIRRVIGRAVDVRTRSPLAALPGFYPTPKGAKENKVDLALTGSSMPRMLISVKWSIRADRERQFNEDFENYCRLNASNSGFGHVLVTNEFDAARLRRNCEELARNASLFTEVVHVNPEGVLAAYGNELRRSAAGAAEHIESGRLMSLEAWLRKLATAPTAP